MLPVKIILISVNLFETIFRIDVDVNFLSHDVLYDLFSLKKVFDEQRGHLDIRHFKDNPLK